MMKGYVKTVFLERPSLSNNTSDVQRLEQALKKETGDRDIRMDLDLIRRLPSKLRAWDFKAKVVLFRNRHGWEILDILDPSDTSPILGCAVDIGTTRVVIRVVDLETGESLGEKGFDNPQAQIGPNVLTRIHYSTKNDGLLDLHNRIIESINENLSDLCRRIDRKPEQVYIMTGAGNTAMTHLFLGIEAVEIIKEPYIPCTNLPDTYDAAGLGVRINEAGRVFLFPNIGSYFGGDLIAGILFSGLDQKQHPCIMVDVGTNAEIVVGGADWLIACAGAAGPALEGGVSKIGMTARPGVIDTVRLDSERDLVFTTIDDEKPVGICGSGMIDLAACLFLSGRIDIRGKFSKVSCKDRLTEIDGILHYILVDKEASGTGSPICISQVDLNSLTSSKAAMYTILEVIVQNTAGLGFEDLNKFYVAGTFGSFINPVSAISIGMLPDLSIDMFEVLGNSSLGGAAELLKDPDAFDRLFAIQKSITYIELNVNQEFMNMFSGAKFYPHTDQSRFPSVTVPD